MKENMNIGSVSADCCMRQTGRSVLQQRIDALRNRANNLQIISDALPKELTPEQDQALWQVADYMVR